MSSNKRLRVDLALSASDVEILATVSVSQFGNVVVLVRTADDTVMQAVELVVDYDPNEGAVCIYVPIMVGALYEDA